MVITVKKGVLSKVPNDSERLRNREGPYELVGKGLADYIQLRKKLYTNDGSRLSWLVLKDRATKIAEKVL